MFHFENYTLFINTNHDKTGVINDPLGQNHSHASSEHCFLLFCFSRFEKWTNGRTTCAKTMIPTGSGFGLAEWIKNCNCSIYTCIILPSGRVTLAINFPSALLGSNDPLGNGIGTGTTLTKVAGAVIVPSGNL